jgi:hypothetical protein
MVMLQHYHSHVHHKMDCGSFVYGYTMKLELSILDSAISSKKLLAIGTFQTRSVERVCAKS